MAESNGAPRMQEMVLRTLSEHGSAIAGLKTDVGRLHADSEKSQAALDRIEKAIAASTATQEAKKPMGAATVLGMCLSAMLCASLTFGALRFFIHSEIDRQNELLQYRVTMMERAFSWKPELVAVNGHALQVGGR